MPNSYDLTSLSPVPAFPDALDSPPGVDPDPAVGDSYPGGCCPCSTCTAQRRRREASADDARVTREAPEEPPCDRCGDRGVPLYSASDHWDTDTQYCLSCAAFAWYQCGACDGFYVSSSDCEDGYCSDCCSCYLDDDYDDDAPTRGIRSYTYKPDARFHGTGPVFLGLELEIETGRAKGVCADIAARHLGSVGYLKEDTSIEYGFEIVTHPMSHEWVANQFPWSMLDELSRNGAEGGDDVGIHVHVSRKGFSGPAHVYRWLKLIYRNQRAVTAIARRDSDHWAPFYDSHRMSAKDYAKGERFADRYAAVNVTNSETFEVRVFASTLDREEVRAALDVVAASVEYTRSLTVREIVAGGWTWTNFIEWCREQGDTYAALVSQSEELV